MQSRKALLKYLPGLLITLSLLSGCSRETGADWYSLDIFLIRGSRLAEIPVAPLLPGETAIQYLESTLSDIQSLENELKGIFEYQQVHFEGSRHVLFQAGENEARMFYLPIANDQYLRCAIYPESNPGQSQVGIGLIGDSLLSTRSVVRIAQRFYDNTEQTEIYTRATVPHGRAVALGRQGDGQSAVFVVIRISPLAIASRGDFLNAVAAYPDFFKGYDPLYVRESVTAMAGQLGLNGDSLMQLARGPQVEDSIRVFSSLTRPPQVRAASPVYYPKPAQKAGQSGRVILSAVIDEHGQVIRTELIRSSGFSPLDTAATQALLRYQFYPGEIDGEPVRTRVTVPFQFKLE